MALFETSSLIWPVFSFVFLFFAGISGGTNALQVVAVDQLEEYDEEKQEKAAETK